MMYPWRINVRDASLTQIGELDDYQRLDMTLKFNDVSTWILTFDRGSRLAEALTADGAGIVVSRDGVPILSGPWTKESHVKNKDTNTLTLSGVDDTAALTRRLAHPQPLTAAPPFSSQEFDSHTGVASTVMRDYVGINIGVTATAARKWWPIFRDPDIFYGDSVSGQGRWQSLLTLVQEMAQAGAVGGLPVGFRIVQVDNLLHYQNYIPVDRTATAVFSEGFGNLEGFTYERTAPTANFVYEGGAGEGTARTIRENIESDSIAAWGRIEGEFVDARSAATDDDMDQAGQKVLDDNGVKTSLSVTPIDTPQLSFGIHYNLGDRVTAVLDQIGPGGGGKPGVAVQDVMRECRITLTPESSTVTPAIGGTGASVTPVQLFRRVRELTTRLVNLERR